MNNSNLKPCLAAVFSAVIWGGAYPVFKVALRELNGLEIITLRHLIAAPVFFLIGHRKIESPRKLSDFIMLTLLALCYPTVYFALEATALTYTTAGQAGMICALFPLMTLVAGRLILNEKFTGGHIQAFFISFLGVTLLSMFSADDAASPNPLLGNIFEVFAMLFAAFYYLLAYHLSKKYSTQTITFFMSVVAIVILLPVLLLKQGPQLPHLSATSLSALLFLSLGSSIIASWLNNYAIKHLKPGKTSFFLNITPVSALLFSQVSGIEPLLNAWQLLGCVLIVGGVFLALKQGV